MLSRIYRSTMFSFILKVSFNSSAQNHSVRFARQYRTSMQVFTMAAIALYFFFAGEAKIVVPYILPPGSTTNLSEDIPIIADEMKTAVPDLIDSVNLNSAKELKPPSTRRLLL